MSTHRTRALFQAAGTLVVGGGLAIVASTLLAGESSPPANSVQSSDAQRAFPEPVLLVEPIEAVRSATLSDWVNVADHVVTAQVTRQERLSAPKSETVRGGARLIGRSVTLRVKDRLWSATDAPRPLSRTITMPALGWLQSQDRMTEMATAGGSRLEVGHTYVIALVWKHAECDSDDYYPAGWSGIGSGGIIPADAGILGNGELQGITEGSVRKSAAREGATGIITGRNARSLRTALNSTKQVANISFLPVDSGRSTAIAGSSQSGV